MADDAPGPGASADVPPAGLAREDAGGAKAVCRHFARRGACLFGDACAFSHDIEPGTPRRPPGENALVTPPRAPTFGRGRRNVGNKAKCSVFRRWALETFGHAFLCSGAGVLDVAGGKGELAFELLNVSGVPVTVVDPRPMRLDAYVRKFRAGFYHRNRAPAVVASVRRPADAPLAAPEHCRVFFFPDAWRERDAEKRRAAARASWRAARETRWSRRGLVAAAADGASAPPPTPPVPGREEANARDETLTAKASLSFRFRDEDETETEDEDEDEAFFSSRRRDPDDGARSAEAATAAPSDRSATYRARGEPVRQRALFESRRRELSAEPKRTVAPSFDEALSSKALDRERRSGETRRRAPETPEKATLSPTSFADDDARACVPEAMDADATFGSLERALSECSVVLGMHPDQATDAIVDFALERGKPFAVVPCCVYSREFPARRRPATRENPRGGGSVTTHAHLVQYLLAKAPGTCRTATLPFGGMNVVVYSLGSAPGAHETCAEIVAPPGETDASDSRARR